jgi:predicted GNAT family acetyltransferase
MSDKSLNLEALSLVQNEAGRQFEMHIGEKMARIEYILTGQKIFLTHTEVDPALEGKGLGSTIIRRTLDWVRSQDLRVIPLCPFVAAFLKKHPKYQDLLADGFRVG